jgi:peptidoglycan pentaglycine glycine transferase (the first glycine)
MDCLVVYNVDMVKSPAEERAAWDDYVVDNGGHPLQLSGWGDVKSMHGWKAKQMFLYNKDDDIIGGAQILVKKLPWPLRSLAYVPRGPIVEEGSGEQVLNLLSTYVKQAYGSVALLVEPDGEEFTLAEGWRRSSFQILPSRTVVLDLEKSEEQLRADMSKKTRQYVRKSGADGVSVKMVRSSKDLDAILDIYRDTAKRAKFGLHSDKYYRDIYEKMGDYAPIFTAYNSEGQMVAFLWLAITADKAYELYGGMNNPGQELRANYALKWHAIKQCKEWGLTKYDFGGMIEGGVSTFKLGWAEGQTIMAGSFVRPLSRWYPIWSIILPIAKLAIRKIKAIFKR